MIAVTPTPRPRVKPAIRTTTGKVKLIADSSVVPRREMKKVSVILKIVMAARPISIGPASLKRTIMTDPFISLISGDVLLILILGISVNM